MKALDPHITSAMSELATKSLHQIQVDTALKWAGRAIVAVRLGLLDDAHEYAHEAIEHAALTGDDKLLGEIRRAFKRAGVEG